MFHSFPSPVEERSTELPQAVAIRIFPARSVRGIRLQQANLVIGIWEVIDRDAFSSGKIQPSCDSLRFTHPPKVVTMPATRFPTPFSAERIDDTNRIHSFNDCGDCPAVGGGLATVSRPELLGGFKFKFFASGSLFRNGACEVVCQAG